MENHEIVSATFQKYYSALKSLDEFGCKGDFFDDVSSLDKFFSEFRNITFVIQKILDTDDNKKAYEDLKHKYLMTEELKWFIKVRNETTKEKPFNLNKELMIDIYLPTGETHRIKDKRLVVNVDDSFSDALDYVRTIFIDEFKMVEVFFTSTIIFRQLDHEIDLYPKIKEGLFQMNNFLNAFIEKFDCNCTTCTELKKRCNILFHKLQSKEITFIRDYSLSDKLKLGIQSDILMSSDGNKYESISSMRVSLDNTFYKEVKGDLIQTFYRFVSIQSAIFKMQKGKIMPTFMVIYNDNTFRLLPFIVTVKATFYRKIREVINLPDFSNVVAVFYCGEYYYYDKDQWEDICDEIYDNRILKAKIEYLCFTMIAKDQNELIVSFDESKMDNMEYIGEQICKSKRNSQNVDNSLDWLNPIRNKFKK